MKRTEKILLGLIIIGLILDIGILPNMDIITRFFQCLSQGKELWCIDNGVNSCVGRICGCLP